MIRDRQVSYPLWAINTSSAPITTCQGSHGTTPWIRAGCQQGDWKGGGLGGGGPKAQGEKPEGRGLMGGGVALR